MIYDWLGKDAKTLDAIVKNSGFEKQDGAAWLLYQPERAPMGEAPAGWMQIKDPIRARAGR